jgi:hypothetical protein
MQTPSQTAEPAGQVPSSADSPPNPDPSIPDELDSEPFSSEPLHARSRKNAVVTLVETDPRFMLPLQGGFVPSPLRG